MSAYETSTNRGFLLSGRDWKIVGTAGLLMLANVLVMAVVAMTPLAVVNQYLFSVPILGVIVYGVAIYAGERVAERGVHDGDAGLALAGVALLQAAFGLFGAGVLSVVPPNLLVPVLGTTALITFLMTAGIGAYVYARSGTAFDHYARWSTYAFLGGLGTILVGSFVFELLLVAGFVLIFTGFLFRLGWEMYRIREERVQSVSLQAIGLYVAVAGVFVHVLQIVVRLLYDR